MGKWGQGRSADRHGANGKIHTQRRPPKIYSTKYTGHGAWGTGRGRRGRWGQGVQAWGNGLVGWSSGAGAGARGAVQWGAARAMHVIPPPLLMLTIQ